MDTILRDILGFISWYLIATLIGWVAFPLSFKYLSALRDRGFTLTRAIGLLVWGFLYWLLTSLRILDNTTTGEILALILMVLIGFLIIRRRGYRKIYDWLRDNRKLVIASEIVFLFSFVLWAFIRSANPEISGTEKPMELAFVNAILHSPGMPPNDPWLSGYAISYYYFGYLMVAMLTRLSGVLPGIGFNLAIALWFALSATGAYGIVYNLLAQPEGGLKRYRGSGIYTVPLFGPLFLLIVANLEGFLEVLHATGLFWKKTIDGSQFSPFWHWLDILDLSNPPAESFISALNRYLPWWRASRVLQDYDLQGGAREIIDEFPQFSYLLADLHPHLLAMPFVLLGIAFALNFYQKPAQKGLALWGIRLPLNWDELIFTGVCLGSLGFLNLWDFPFAVLLFTGAYLLRSYSAGSLSLRKLADGLLLFILVILAGAVLYLPFYLSFSSQAGGLVPSLVYSTRGAHFWVMFGPLLVPMIAYLTWRICVGKGGWRFERAFLLSIGILTAAFVLMLLAGWLGWSLPDARAWLSSVMNAQGQFYLTVVMVTLQRRLVAPGTWLSLAAILAGVMALLMRPSPDAAMVEGKPASLQTERKHKPDFAPLVMGVGLLLLVIPEFFYLRDQFGWRMNTIFKFYFHAWILLSICAAYGFIRVMSETGGRRWMIVKVGLLITLAASLVYTPLMLEIKTGGFGTLQTRTLDGNRYFSDYYPEEAQAIEWLGQREVGVVAEAVGGSYTGYARVSTLTGFPTVLGWPGHESQWRGGDSEMGSRFADIDLLYATPDWHIAEVIIRQYDIRYIYIGSLERSTYHVNDRKFREHLPLIYELGSTAIFEVAGSTE